jgi:hypothetical protein
MGGMANSVDYQLMMLRVGWWKAWLADEEKLLAETSSYKISDILLYQKGGRTTGTKPTIMEN